MERVKIRRLTKEDKEAVMKLRDDVYEGMDFLPAYYDYFLTSTKVYPGAVLYDGKLVSMKPFTRTLRKTGPEVIKLFSCSTQ